MNHTKEPWGIDREKATPENQLSSDRIRVVGAYDGLLMPQGHGVADIIVWGERGTADAERIVACVNACARLPDPEANIKELVEAAKAVDESISRTMQSMACWKNVTRLKQARAPFEKNTKGDPQ